MSNIKYTVTKEMEIAGCHQLTLPYKSKCENRHGHNWMVYVTVSCTELDHDMVIDFTHLKKQIHDKLDHGDFNELFDFNPTAENIGKWIMDTIDLIRAGANCTKVEIHESRGNVAIVEKM